MSTAQIDHGQIDRGQSLEGTSPGAAESPRAREPYTPPAIEMFPPMHDVTFGTNVNPTTAMTVIG